MDTEALKIFNELNTQIPQIIKDMKQNKLEEKIIKEVGNYAWSPRYTFGEVKKIPEVFTAYNSNLLNAIDIFKEPKMVTDILINNLWIATKKELETMPPQQKSTIMKQMMGIIDEANSRMSRETRNDIVSDIRRTALKTNDIEVISDTLGVNKECARLLNMTIALYDEQATKKNVIVCTEGDRVTPAEGLLALQYSRDFQNYSNPIHPDTIPTIMNIIKKDEFIDKAEIRRIDEALTKLDKEAPVSKMYGTKYIKDKIIKGEMPRGVKDAVKVSNFINSHKLTDNNISYIATAIEENHIDEMLSEWKKEEIMSYVKCYQEEIRLMSPDRVEQKIYEYCHAPEEFKIPRDTNNSAIIINDIGIVLPYYGDIKDEPLEILRETFDKNYAKLKRDAKIEVKCPDGKIRTGYFAKDMINNIKIDSSNGKRNTEEVLTDKNINKCIYIEALNKFDKEYDIFVDATTPEAEKYEVLETDNINRAIFDYNVDIQAWKPEKSWDPDKDLITSHKAAYKLSEMDVKHKRPYTKRELEEHMEAKKEKEAPTVEQIMLKTLTIATAAAVQGAKVIKDSLDDLTR